MLVFNTKWKWPHRIETNRTMYHAKQHMHVAAGVKWKYRILHLHLWWLSRKVKVQTPNYNYNLNYTKILMWINHDKHKQEVVNKKHTDGKISWVMFLTLKIKREMASTCMTRQFFNICNSMKSNRRMIVKICPVLWMAMKVFYFFILLFAVEKECSTDKLVSPAL